MWLCRECLAIFNNPLHLTEKIGQAEQTQTKIHSHFKDTRLQVLVVVINQTARSGVVNRKWSIIWLEN